MIKNITKAAIIFINLILLFQCGGKKEEISATRFAAEVESLSERTVASLERTGPYKNIGATLNELSARLDRENISVTGTPFIVYYNDPARVPQESLNWAVCIPVPAGVTVNPQSGIKIEKVPATLFAATIHVGGYEQIADTYDRLEDWIDEQGLMITGPAMEFFLSPDNTPSESMQIKVGFVVESVPDSIVDDGEKDEEGEYEYEEETEAEGING